MKVKKLMIGVVGMIIVYFLAGCSGGGGGGTSGGGETYTLTVTKAGTGTGTVSAAGCTLSPSGNGWICTASSGTTITLSATPGTGSTFAGWSNGTGSAANCTGTGACTFTITANSSLTATFNTTSVSSELSGTVAAGKPLANANVTIKDVNGNTKTGSTGTDGKYSVNVADMTEPFLLKVTSGTVTLYGVATAKGTANIHPFTDLIIKNWYRVQGKDVDTVFSGTGQMPNPPTPNDISTIEEVIRNILANLLISVGLDPTQFNLITTPFDADGKGFDNILDRTRVNITGNTVTIDMVDPNTGTTGDTPLASMPLDTNLQSDPIAQAKSAINTQLDNLKNTVNTKGCNLTVNDLQPYFTNNFLHDGWLIADFVDFFTGGLGCPSPWRTVSAVFVSDLINYDAVNQEITFKMVLQVSDGSETATDMVFKNDNGTWKAKGNQRIANIWVRSRVDYYARAQNPGYEDMLDIDVEDYLGQIVAVTVSGTGLQDNTQIPLYCSKSTDPDCEAENEFQLKVNMQSVVGSVYTVTVQRTNGSFVNYRIVLVATPGVSREGTDIPTIQLDNPTHSISSVKGTTVTGCVYTPIWVSETPRPFVESLNGSRVDDELGNPRWLEPPQRGKCNKFSVDIPATYGGQDVISAILGQDANNWVVDGWGTTHFYWIFE